MVKAMVVKCLDGDTRVGIMIKESVIYWGSATVARKEGRVYVEATIREADEDRSWDKEAEGDCNKKSGCGIDGELLAKGSADAETKPVIERRAE
jgi:hypothetical protein